MDCTWVCAQAGIKEVVEEGVGVRHGNDWWVPLPMRMLVTLAMIGVRPVKRRKWQR